MSAAQVDVWYRKGTLPVQSNNGVLAFSEAGITYSERGGAEWSWPWDGARVWFDPPGQRSGRAGAFALVGVAALLIKKSDRALILTAPDAEVCFELHKTAGVPRIVAQQVVDTVPAASGHISVGDVNV